MRAFLEAFNRHDVDAIMSFFVDDCEFDTPKGPTPYGRRLRGKAEVREGIAARFQGIPDVDYTDDNHCDQAASGKGAELEAASRVPHRADDRDSAPGMDGSVNGGV